MARRKTQSRVQDRGGWAGNASTGRADAWVRSPRAEPEANPLPLSRYRDAPDQAVLMRYRLRPTRRRLERRAVSFVLGYGAGFT
jgi:hypothetical protein